MRNEQTKMERKVAGYCRGLRTIGTPVTTETLWKYLSGSEPGTSHDEYRATVQTMIADGQLIRADDGTLSVANDKRKIHG